MKRQVFSAGTHVLDEAERSLHDALCVLSQTVKDSRVVYGGGWPEMQMAAVVQKEAARTPGKRSLAMEAFALALRAIPATICDNAGIVPTVVGLPRSESSAPREDLLELRSVQARDILRC